MKFLVSDKYPAYQMKDALCFVYGPDNVLNAYVYDRNVFNGAKGTFYKHKSNLKKFINNTKCLNNVASKVNTFAKNTKGMGQVPALITGVAYSLATIYAPKYARKLGGWISDKLGIKPYDEDKKA